MVDFNRSRTRDMGTRTVQLVHYGDQSRIMSGTLVNRKTIWDHFPVGKFQPNVVKVTDVQLSEVKQSADSGVWHWYDTYPGTSRHHAYGYFIAGLAIEPVTSYIPLPTDDTIKYNSLMLRSFAKINADELGIAESLGEASQTISMLRKPLSSLLRLFREALVSRTGRPRALKDASSAWLELRYGWRPLIGVISDLISKGLPAYREGMIVSFSASEKETATAHASWALRSCAYSSTKAFWSSGVKTTTTRWTARHYATVTDPYALRARKLGGHILNVPALAWEFTRLSFAVDWWFNVGDFISALMPTSGVSVNTASYSVQVKEKVENYELGAAFNKSPYDLIRVPGRNAAHISDRNSYRRLVVPVVNVTKNFHLDSRFRSLSHLIDAAALTIQRIPTSRRRT